MSEVVRFESPKRGQKLTKIIAIGLQIIALPGAVAIPPPWLKIAQRLWGIPLWLCFGLDLLLAWGIVRLWWKFLASEMRFDVVLGPEGVEIGTGQLCWHAEYDEIDLIVVHKKSQTSLFHLEVHAGGKRAHARFEPPVAEACAAALRIRCPDAVFIGSDGVEAIPAGSRKPIRNLCAVEQYYARNSLVLAMFGVLCILSMLIVASRGHRALWKVVLEFLCPALLLFLIGTTLRRNRQKIRAAREARAGLEEKDMQG